MSKNVRKTKQTHTNSLKLITRTFSYSLPSLPLISQSDEVTGNRARIKGGIPKIYLKETKFNSK